MKDGSCWAERGDCADFYSVERLSQQLQCSGTNNTGQPSFPLTVSESPCPTILISVFDAGEGASRCNLLTARKDNGKRFDLQRSRLFWGTIKLRFRTLILLNEYGGEE
ncbi:hypothetical protein TNCV_518931 [Trichonephila clavipes]|nr:hypothetical protein TNCV_518931 [Trichonephila clavipes]